MVETSSDRTRESLYMGAERRSGSRSPPSARWTGRPRLSSCLAKLTMGCLVGYTTLGTPPKNKKNNAAFAKALQRSLAAHSTPYRIAACTTIHLPLTCCADDLRVCRDVCAVLYR